MELARKKVNTREKEREATKYKRENQWQRDEREREIAKRRERK